jgi:DNA invertase Pin-like site-specific DNA recombinase
MATAKRVAIYTRVSTDTQTTENQLRELQTIVDRQEGWNLVAVYEDHGISGAKGRKDRPALDALLKGVVRREFDLVAAWSVDRLGRSLRDLLELLGDFHAKGVDLYLHQQGMDTTTPSGRAMFQMMGVFAEFERAMIRERVNAGLARARAQGKILGRPKIAADIEAQIRATLLRGIGVVKTARTLGLGTGTVQRIKREMAQAA